jgi:hypothetical protein
VKPPLRPARVLVVRDRRDSLKALLVTPDEYTILRLLRRPLGPRYFTRWVRAFPGDLIRARLALGPTQRQVEWESDPPLEPELAR